MPTYEHITRYIDRIKALSSEAECRQLHREFLESCYDPFVLDRDYSDTLDMYGLGNGRHLHANVEMMNLEAAVAALTLIHRAERGVYRPGDPTPLMHAFENGYAVRLLQRIAELDGTWERPNVVTFYHEYDKYGFLSNWYKAPFEFHGNTFPTTEHWMMWQKARLFGDRETADKILQATDLDEVKRLGRQVKPYVDAAWREVRLPVMRVGLRQKFAQNERLLNELLSTGSAVLAEVAPNDTIWGVGIGSDDSRASDPAEWHGQNLLGRLLMEVRSELRVMPPSGKQATAWSGEGLMRSQLWDMSLLELARMPSTRPAAIMYATYAAQHVPHFRDAHDVLREVRASICGIDESMRLNMGEGLPIAGWRELIDELSLRAYLDGHETRTAGFVVGEEPPRSVRKSSGKGDCSRE